MTLRSIRAVHAARRDDIGDLVTRRPLPGPALAMLDPFLFLNHHGPQSYPPENDGLPFGPHPHRGFETVTFILQGSLAHRDSAGHESVIDAGGIQWMTAGRGIVHAELSPQAFRRQGGSLEILQLWVNLPARLKMTAPAYVGLQRHDIPRVPTPDGRGHLNLIAGRWALRDGPVQSLTGVFAATVDLAAGARLAIDRLAGRTVFLYVVRGAIEVRGRAVSAFHLAELSEEEDGLDLQATSEATLLLLHAEPIREPVVSHGPFVMSTRAQILEAIRDYEAGRFGDRGSTNG